MHRLIVVILSAVDAAIAASVGIAATLAPLTVLWVFGLGGTADWGALWPAGATIWQLGHLVPLQVTLPGEYLAVAGIEPAAASFVVSLAPLALAGFTAIFAVRSGMRASQADAWITGVISGAIVFTALTAVIAGSAAHALAKVETWEAILFPALVFALPLLMGAVITEWREAGAGVLARIRDRVEAAPHGWGEVPALLVRAAAVALVGLIGLGALAFAVALTLRGGEVIALYEAAHVDVLGATLVTLAQLAYLPTLVIWGLAFVAGPGFAVGAGSAVSPAGTQLAPVPGVPVLGALPESSTPWLLLLALLPVALGALAGWVARSRLVAAPSAPAQVAASQPVASGGDTGADAARSSALSALLAGADRLSSPEATEPATEETGDRIGPRAVLALGIALLAGTGAGVLALVAAGSIGPGRLAEVGPQPGPVALAVGLEVLLGASILLLSPRRRAALPTSEQTPDAAPWPAASVAAHVTDQPAPTADLGHRRPQPLPSPRTAPATPVD